MKLNIPTPQLHGLETQARLLGLFVNAQQAQIEVRYVLDVLAPDGTVVATYEGLYAFSDNEAQSVNRVRNLNPEQLPIRPKVAGDGKATSWIDQLAPAIVPGIEAEIAELLTPEPETEKEAEKEPETEA